MPLAPAVPSVVVFVGAVRDVSSVAGTSPDQQTGVAAKAGVEACLLSRYASVYTVWPLEPTVSVLPLVAVTSAGVESSVL